MRGHADAAAEPGAPVVVIGGTRGTGLLIARRLHDAGVPVRAAGRNRVFAAKHLPPAVEIVAVDLTKPDTLPPALTGARDIIFTAGVHSGYPAREATIRAVEFDGLRHTLAAARAAGFHGRLLYMTSCGVATPSFAATFLNAYKGNALVWRLRAEDEIGASGFDYTIVRAGFLLNAAGGRHALRITQEALPLSLRHRIARADVAETFVAARTHPAASRATFEVVWGGKGARTEDPATLLTRLAPDEPAGTGR